MIQEKFITSDIVNATPNEVFATIKYLFNISLQESFPDKLKIGNVTPIFKNGDKSLLTNCRPSKLSVLPCFSKLLKYVTYNRLYEFVIKNETFYEKEIGFQATHSGEHTILEVVNSISNSVENGKFTLGTFIDFSKAFDTLDHTILLNKLNQDGVKNKYYDWFRCYLINRKQFIFHGEEILLKKS